MSHDEISTRRRFFVGASAALAAPAAVAAQLGGGGAERGALEARLAELEDERAIRELQRAYVQHVNARSPAAAAALFAEPERGDLDPAIAALADDMAGAAARIEIAADRRSAIATAGCVVSIETPIAPGCTLVDMALAQGEGVLRRTERRELTQTFVRRNGIWKIERVSLRGPIRPA